MASMDSSLVHFKIRKFLSKEPRKSHSLKSICEFVGCDKKLVNKLLYSMEKLGMVMKTQESNPPKWQILDKKYDFSSDEDSSSNKS